MKEFAFTVDLKNNPALIEQYKRHHQQVWPEVIEGLKKVGVVDMQIFLLGNRLFMHVKAEDGFDPGISFKKYSTLHPKIEEWEHLMDSFQERIVASSEGEKWVMMEKIFQLE